MLNNDLVIVRINLLVLLFTAFLFTGCYMPKIGMSKSKSINKYIEEFYKGPEETLYFIKPVSFPSTTKKGELLVADYVINYSKNKALPITFNFTYRSSKPLPSIDSLYILIHDLRPVKVSNIKKMFIERKDAKTYNSRYTCELSTEQFKQVAGAIPVKFTLYYNGGVSECASTRKWKSVSSAMQFKLFYDIESDSVKVRK